MLPTWRTLILVCIGGFFFDLIVIRLKIFETVYNRYPGTCTKFSMNGAEDILILPNNQAIITGGLKLHPTPVNNGALYVLDMTDPHKGPRQLKMEGGYSAAHPDFNPHGISYWITDNGVIFLYVITHWMNYKDTIEVFQYYPDRKSVRFIRSIYDKLMTNLNNLVMLGKNEFYVTQWKFFNNDLLHTLEQLLHLPLTNVYHVMNGKVQAVVTGLCSANGINKSRNNKFVYVINNVVNEIIAYRRSVENGSLSFADSIQLDHPVDNIYMDEETGNLWLALFNKPFQLLKYLKDPRLNPNVASLILQMTVDESSNKPFEGSKIEAVYQSDGSNGIGAISIAAYSNNTLLLGSVLTNMIVCDVNYLQF